MSRIRKQIGKEVEIFATVMLLVSMLSVTVFAALATWVTERYKATGDTNRYVVSISENAPGASYALNTSGTQTFYITNLDEAGNDGNYLYDIIILPNDEANAASITCNEGTLYSYTEYDAAGVGTVKYPSGAKIYTGVDSRTDASFEVAAAGIEYTVAVVKNTGHNYYVSSSYELQMASTGYLRNFGDEQTGKSGLIPAVSGETYAQGNTHGFVIDDSRANVYIVADFAIDEDCVFRAPGTFNLLTSNITLNAGASFKIEHDYVGVYAITTLGGKINNTNAVFTVNAPRAYYLTETQVTLTGSFAAEEVVTLPNSNFTKSSDKVDFTANAAALAALKADAAAYVEAYIKNCGYVGTNGAAPSYYILSDIDLPETYRGYNVTYSYASTVDSAVLEVTDGLNGKVTRSAASSSGTLTATAAFAYDGASVPGTAVNITVPGTDSSANRSAFIDAVGGYVNANQPTGEALTFDTDIFAIGIDVWKLIKEYCEEADYAPEDLSLAYSENELVFDIIGVETGAVAETTTPVNNITFTGATPESIGLDGFSSISQVIVNHPYYTAEDTETVQLKSGDNVLGSFVLTYRGTTIDERNAYVERNAPELYIASAVEGETPSVDVFNITATGTYSGTELITPTRLSTVESNGEYIDYELYYFNTAAQTALEGLDAYLNTQYFANDAAKRIARSAVIEDIIAGTIDSDYTTGLYSSFEPDLTGVSVSTTYNGVNLLGEAGGANHLFELTNGRLSLAGNTLIVYDGAIFLVGNISYSDGETGYSYYLKRRLYSPSEGLGGTNTSYVRGDTFDDTFNRESSEWLSVTTPVPLDVSSPRYITGLTYTVTAQGTNSFTRTVTSAVSGNTVTGIASQTNDGTGCSYFNIGYDNGYKINVTTAFIPYVDSTVTVAVTITDGSTPVTETYSFIIPGIIHYGTDLNYDDNIAYVKDIWIYLRMLQVYGNTNGFLLTSDVQQTRAANNPFECNYNDIDLSVVVSGETVNIDYLVTKGIISAPAPAKPAQIYEFDLDGIQYAVNTANMDFSTLKLDNLKAFDRFSANSLTELNLSDCGISDAMLSYTENSAVYTPLHKLNVLETLNISLNDEITAVNGSVLYRTIKTLTANGCAIVSLDGIDGLVQLETLNIESNGTKDFYPLTKVSSLTTVYLGGNTVEGDTDRFYGTHGKINICNIVALMHNGATVYVENNQPTIIYEYYEEAYYIGGALEAATASQLGVLNDFSDVASSGILNTDGHLITLEEEYLSVVANAMFNFEKYTVSAQTLSAALDEMFPDIHEDNSGSAVTYSVTPVVITAPIADNSEETFRLAIQYHSGGYRYSGNYNDYEEGVTVCETIYREVTFTYVGPTA